MTFDPICTIVGHVNTVKDLGSGKTEKKKELYSVQNPNKKALQLGGEFICFLKNDTNAAADGQLTKNEAIDGFKAFLKGKYGASDECIATFLPDFERDFEATMRAMKAAEPKTHTVDGQLAFKGLIIDADVHSFYTSDTPQYPSYQFFAVDNTDNSKDGVFQKIVNLSKTQDSLCVPATTQTPHPVQPPPPPTPAGIKHLTLGSGLKGTLDPNTGDFAVGSKDTYSKIADAVLADPAAKAALQAEYKSYMDYCQQNRLAYEKWDVVGFTAAKIQAQAIKQQSGDEQWPLIGKTINLYDAINTPMPLPPAAPTVVNPTAPATEPGTTTVTTTQTASGGFGLLDRLKGLGSKWLLVLGAVGLGFLLQGRQNSPSAYSQYNC